VLKTKYFPKIWEIFGNVRKLLSLTYCREVREEVHYENCMTFSSTIRPTSPTTVSVVFHSTPLKRSSSYVMVEQFTGKYILDMKIVDALHEEKDESDDDVCYYGVWNLSVSLR
jgi:hypothetical protein